MKILGSLYANSSDPAKRDTAKVGSLIKEYVYIVEISNLNQIMNDSCERLLKRGCVRIKTLRLKNIIDKKGSILYFGRFNGKFGLSET